MSVEAAVMFDALEELRAEIEEAAQDQTLDSETRVARLREFRGDLTELLGLIDTYLGDEQASIEGQQPRLSPAAAALRENADIRERLIATEKATPEVCDSLLLYSHSELDDLDEEGLLEETALHVAAFMAGLAKFDPAKHPRGRGGKFSEVFGKVKKMKVGHTLPLEKGVRVRRSEKSYSVHHFGRVVSTHTEPEHAARSAHAAITSPVRRGDARRKDRAAWDKKLSKNAEVPTRPSTAAARTATERNLSPEDKKRLYDERKAALEQRAAEAVKRAAQRGKLSDAEAHFNDAGKVSQRTLGRYVEEAATKPQTIDRYSKLDAHGDRVWHPSRRELHERIITAHLKKRQIDAETGRETLDYSPDAEDIVAHPDGPSVLFSGGGYAAGKGRSIKVLRARGDVPPDAFVLDPDTVKAELPEFGEMLGSDPEANMHVYREAWEIAQEIQARAMDRKLNIIVDGISNTSPEEMGQRARAFTSRGYSARAVYTDIPTEEAMKRAAQRAETAKEESDRRMIPSIIMRSVHRDVAATVPSLPGYLDDHQIPLSLEVYDNDQGQDEHGQFRPPKLFFSHTPDGGRMVHDQALWDRFLAKGHEVLPDVGGVA